MATLGANVHIWLAACGLILAPFWGIGQVVRDATRLSGLCFYIPSPFLAALLVAGSLLCAVRQRWRIAACAACLAVLPLAALALVENHWSSPASTATHAPFRVVHWNVASRLTQPGARDALLANKADLYVLSEVPNAASVEELREALGATYRAEVFANLAVVGSGQVRAEGWLINRRRMRVQKVTWQTASGPLVLLVVDLPSNVRLPRDPMLREIDCLIDEHRPDLVVGDFNAPRRSRALCELPAGYRHAYDTAGAGWGYTWPVPAPMYSLDQCIHSAAVTPVRYELQTTWHSDHRIQVFDFAWRAADSAAMMTHQ